MHFSVRLCFIIGLSLSNNLEIITAIPEAIEGGADTSTLRALIGELSSEVSQKKSGVYC